MARRRFRPAAQILRAHGPRQAPPGERDEAMGGSQPRHGRHGNPAGRSGRMNDAALPAMPIPSDSLWSRLRTTPLRDAIRGRLTASLDFRRVIVAAGLPEPLSGLIYITVRRARLWRS